MIFQMNLGTGWEDISDYVRDNYSLTEAACSPDYKYAKNTLDFGLTYNEDLFSRLHSILDYVYVRVYEDDGITPVFIGRFVPCVGLIYNGILDIQQMTISVEDYSSMLDVTMEEFVTEDMKILDPSDATHSIIHVLFTHLGLSHSLIDSSVSILDTVGAAVADDDTNALDFVSTLLYEYGWVPNWSAAGLFRPIRWIQEEDAETTFTFNDDNIIGQIEESPKDLDKEGAKVYWYGLAERANTRVYTEDLKWDEDGDFEGYPILRETFYPDEANVIDETTGTYQVVEQEYTETGIRYQPNKYIDAGYAQDFALEHADFTRILVTKNHTIGDRYDAGLTRDITVFGNKKAQIRYWNPMITSRQLYYMHINADITYTKSRNTTKVEYVTNTKKIDEYDSSFLFSAAYADRLAKAMAMAMRLGRYTYKIVSEEKVAEGSYVGIVVSNGIVATGLVLERMLDGLTGLYSYTIRSYDTNYMPVAARTTRLSSLSADDAIGIISAINKSPVFSIEGNKEFSYYVGESTPVNASLVLSATPSDPNYEVTSYQWYYRTEAGVDTEIVGATSSQLTINYNETWFYPNVTVICDINGKYSFTAVVKNTYNASYLGDYSSDPDYAMPGDWYFYTGATGGERTQYTMYLWDGAEWIEDTYPSHNVMVYDLISSVSSLTLYSGGVFSPPSVTLNSKRKVGQSAYYDYDGRFTVEEARLDSTYSGVYASTVDESSYIFPPSGTISSLRFRLYEAGDFTELLDEYTLPVTMSASSIEAMTPRYWGALTSAPTDLSVHINDYYFDSNTAASGGGKIRYYTGVAWIEMTTSHPYYATALKTVMTDLMVWATAQGETVAAANAVFESIVAAEAFIDQLSATVLNAAIARINEYLAIGDNGYVAGPDGAGTTEGDLRTFLDRDEVGIQEWRSSAWKSLLRIGVDGPAGSRHSAITFGEDVASIYQLQKGNGRPVLDGEFIKRVDRELYIEEKTISSTSRSWHDIAWSPELGLFVVVARDSTVCATSPDGINWTERTISSTSGSWTGIAWSPELGLFVTIASSSTVCATSPDGINWTERTISSTSRSWNGIAWSPELGLFVITAGSSTVCATSPDGINWTERTISSASRSWRDIAWSPELGLFVTTAYDLTVCATSPDGINWTERTISSTSRYWTGIAWSPELGLFVAIVYDSTVCATSPDGINWTERTISSASRNWTGIAWSPELGLFVTTAYDSTVCGLVRGYELCEVGAGIIESGAYAGGYYCKWSDGRMEYEKRGSAVTSSNSTNLFGSSSGTTYYGSAAVTLPPGFVSIDFLNAGQNNANVGYTAQAAYGSLTSCTVYVTSGNASAQTVNFSVRVAGRWRA